ncbi:MAG: hypothetical protein H0X45_04085 [Planctomycetes bacterium]|nr:hypothetical protein [Planctomycetota bacterium]
MWNHAWLALVMAPAFAVAADLTEPINTICPVDGMVVDAKSDPIVVSDSSGRQSELVPLGVCAHATCAQKVRSDPQAYLDAARRDKVAELDGGHEANRETAWDDGDRAVVTTDASSRGKAADPAERDLMNDRPNALNLKQDFEDLGKSADQIEGDRMEENGEGTMRQ